MLHDDKGLANCDTEERLALSKCIYDLCIQCYQNGASEKDVTCAILKIEGMISILVNDAWREGMIATVKAMKGC